MDSILYGAIILLIIVAVVDFPKLRADRDIKQWVVYGGILVTGLALMWVRLLNWETVTPLTFVQHWLKPIAEVIERWHPPT